MGDPVTLGGLLIKVGTSLAASGVKAGYAKLIETPQFKKAMDETKAAFPSLELEPSLKAWCASSEFEMIILSLQKGDRTPEDESVIDSFIRISNFFDGDNTQSSAKSLLEFLFARLETAIINSPEGLAAVAGRQEILHEETRAFTKEAVRPFAEQLSKVSETLTAIQSNLPDSSATAQKVEEAVYQARIDEARRLLDSGKPKTAKEILETLRKELNKKNPSRSLLFRIATNLGSCAIRLNDKSTAIRELQLAYSLESDNPKAMANAASAALIDGKNQEALRLAQAARQANAQDSVATANYIQALFATGADPQLVDLIKSEPWIQTDFRCCFVIGSFYSDRGKYNEAEKYFREALKIEPDDAQNLIFLAQSIMQSAKATKTGEPRLAWRLRVDESTRLDEAHRMLNQAISILQPREETKLLAFAYVLRADTRRMLENELDSISDCDAALIADPTNDYARLIKAFSLIQSGRADEAIACMVEITQAEPKDQVSFPLAAAYVEVGKATKAIDILLPFWTGTSRSDKRLLAAEVLLSVYDQTRETEKAEAIVIELQKTWPQNPEALATLGRHQLRKGNIKDASSLLGEALAYSTGPGKDFIALELADIYYKERTFDKAADLYAVIADVDSDNAISQRHVVCLFNSGAYKQALEVCRRIRKGGAPLNVISHVEAKVLIEFGDLALAQGILEQLSELFPHVHTYKIETAECALRRGQMENARAILSKITIAAIGNNAKFLMRLAQLRALTEMPDVLVFAYEARRIAFSDPEIHLSYAALFHNQERNLQTVSALETVQIDCAVILETLDGKVYYTILDRPDIHTERGEISAKHAEDLKIIGKHKGDRFVLRQNPWEQVESTVVEVQSKYVRAFQETFEKFPVYFPTSGLLQSIRGPYEEFRDKMLKQLDEDQNRVNKIIEVYQAKKLSVEVLAKMQGRSLLETWAFLTGGNYCKLLASPGTIEVREQESEVLTSATVIVLELTSILAFAQLGLLERLPKRFNSLLTTQAVLDEVNEALVKNASSKPGELTIGKVGNQYVRDEITADRLEKNRQFLEGIQKFIISSVSIEAINSDQEGDASRWAELKDLIGPVSTSCILVAHQKNAILLSDDEMLRALAQNDWKLRGVWTQSVLHELRRREILTAEEYAGAAAKLVLFNYKFVSLSHDSILWILHKTDFQLKATVKMVLDVFRGPECSLESAVGVLSDVVKSVWLETKPHELKIDVLDYVLEVIVAGRPQNAALEMFSLLIKVKFALWPTAEKAILRRIKLWQQSQLDRSGLIYLSHSRAY